MTAGAPRFVLFGPAHLVTLALVAGVAVALVVLVRQRPALGDGVRRTLAFVLLAMTAAVIVYERRRGTTWAELAPLQLCDLAIFVGAWALLTRAPLACELVYFWGCAGTTLALLTPELVRPFPDPVFLAYFALHGAVVVTALVLVVGLGHVPRPGAASRAWAWTNVYAALVAGVNALFHTNFLYLCARPTTPSPLDWFGPWPVYLLAAEGVAAALFTLLALPFRHCAARGGTSGQ